MSHTIPHGWQGAEQQLQPPKPSFAPPQAHCARPPRRLTVRRARALPRAFGASERSLCLTYIRSGTMCFDGCGESHTALYDVCDDGGPGSESGYCWLGFDCSDCGSIVASPNRRTHRHRSPSSTSQPARHPRHAGGFEPWRVLSHAAWGPRAASAGPRDDWFSPLSLNVTASSWSDAGLPKYVTVVGRGGLVSIGIDKTSSLDLRVAMEKGSLGANASVLVEGSGGISGMSFSAGIQQGCIDAPTPLLQPCYTPADVQGTLVPFGMGNWHASPGVAQRHRAATTADAASTAPPSLSTHCDRATHACILASPLVRSFPQPSWRRRPSHRSPRMHICRAVLARARAPHREHPVTLASQVEWRDDSILPLVARTELAYSPPLEPSEGGNGVDVRRGSIDAHSERVALRHYMLVTDQGEGDAFTMIQTLTPSGASAPHPLL